MALTAEQEDLRNKLAYQMMNEGGDQETINQWAALEGMRRNPYGDQYGDGGDAYGGTGGQGGRGGAPPDTILDAIQGPSNPNGPPPDLSDTKGSSKGDTKGNTDPAITEQELNAIMSEPGSLPGNPQGTAIDMSGLAPVGTMTGTGLGTQSSIQQGIDAIQGQPQSTLQDQPQSMLENPEALQAYAQQEDPQQGEQQGYEGQTAAEAAAGSFGGNAAAQDAWGSAYGDAIAAGLSDDDAAAAADAAAGGYDGYGDDEDGY